MTTGQLFKGMARKIKPSTKDTPAIIHTYNATWSEHSLTSHSTYDKLFRRWDRKIKSSIYMYSTHATRAVSVYWITHTNVQFMQWADALSVIKTQFMPCSCTVTLAPVETWKHNIKQRPISPCTMFAASLIRSVIILMLSTDVGLFGSSRYRP